MDSRASGLALNTIDDVIAYRVLEIRSAYPQRFEIFIGRPKTLPSDPEHYYCPFQITGSVCGSFVRYAEGADSLEAIQEAMAILAVIVYALPFQYQEEAASFWWAGRSNDLGFPEPPSLRAGLAAYRRLDFRESLPLLLPFAERGVAEIQGVVGSMYSLGQAGGIDPDPTLAIHWLLRSAEQGNGQAYHDLAFVYGTHPELNTDPELVKTCARKAVENGFLLAWMAEHPEDLLE